MNNATTSRYWFVWQLHLQHHMKIRHRSGMIADVADITSWKLFYYCLHLMMKITATLILVNGNDSSLEECTINWGISISITKYYLVHLFLPRDSFADSFFYYLSTSREEYNITIWCECFTIIYMRSRWKKWMMMCSRCTKVQYTFIIDNYWLFGVPHYW